MLKKNLKPLALSAMFAVTFATGAVHADESGIVLKEASSTDGDYCHIKYMAFTEQSLQSGDLQFDSSDVIDMYGSCNFNPKSQDEVKKQLSASNHNRFSEGSNDSSGD